MVLSPVLRDFARNLAGLCFQGGCLATLLSCSETSGLIGPIWHIKEVKVNKSKYILAI